MGKKKKHNGHKAEETLVDSYVTESFEEKEAETPAEEAENVEETKVLTEELHEALKQQEEEEIIDAKIRQGIQEAADEFRKEQAQAAESQAAAGAYGAQPTGTNAGAYANYAAAGQAAAGAYGGQPAGTNPGAYGNYAAADQAGAGAYGAQPAGTNAGAYAYNAYAYNPQAAGEQAYAGGYQEYDQREGGDRVMEEKGRNEEGTINYEEKKQKTGWWKIVMLVLASIITVCIFLITLFSGLNLVQNRLMGSQRSAQVYEYRTPEDFGPYYYEEYDDYGYNEDYPSESNAEMDEFFNEIFSNISVADVIRLFEAFGGENVQQIPQNENGGQQQIPQNENGGQQESNINKGTEGGNTIADWFSQLF